ncbi:V-containing nitrogenase subunit delta [Acidithiobacillus ferrooxidans]|uniref:V-containing nitrogenase subunit delta n=1 Tax=Acidithiobacillus ferrooxidans TaxID=920 RepID=UPI000AF1CEC4|nr:V-containing nitrogenase subunit delta [Acidithiobacillus ferrooxidans]MCR2828827.1 V-containing nitrogenase subunit delta [Acidithiobacillus ferrooxidans]
MNSKVDDLFGYVQERCLWQFSSRAWDRHENIDGVIEKVTVLLMGEDPGLGTPMDRLHYADAKIMVPDIKERYPWIDDAEPAQIRELMQGLKERLVEIAITRSKNHELNHTLY